MSDIYVIWFEVFQMIPQIFYIFVFLNGIFK